MVSEAVHPEQYREKPPLLAGYYSYWSGLPMDGRFETYIRDKRAFAAMPTHDDLTLVIAGWPYAEFAENKKDIEGNYLKAIELAPAFAERLRSATREAPFAGAAVPNYFRKPYGPGWALVGDAGYNRDFSNGAGNSRCLPRRRTLRDGTRPIVVGRAAVRGCHGRDTSAPATRTLGRCTISPATSQRWSRRRPSCNRSLGRFTATRRPWTALRV